MKSLVEEASSVSLALEKAWKRAGKPQSFSVKIFEEAESGFLGFNKKPAKIGIFFEESNKAQERTSHKKPHHGQRSGQQRNNQRPRSTMRNDRNDRNDRQTDSRKPSRPYNDKKDDRGPKRERFQDRKSHNTSNRPKASENTPKPTTKKETATSTAPKKPEAAIKKTIKRVLKVSNRRYSGPKKPE